VSGPRGALKWGIDRWKELITVDISTTGSESVSSHVTQTTGASDREAHWIAIVLFPYPAAAEIAMISASGRRPLSAASLVNSV
jgi:hypothetical protein